ncbi:hypothetical protein D4Q76_01555 [archaeon]|nr:MAG: hypothetical protein D4Q76_01555 [archaeon]
MGNTKESKTKKAVAFAVAVLIASMSLTSSVALAQQFDDTKSSVVYCSKPLKVKLGPVYDYRYFVYASKVGSSDLNIKIEKGFAHTLENLYPGSKAQLNGKQITIKESTSFILHDLGGLELALSGGSDVQFVPSEKCDELVATMTSISGYSKQKLVDDENLVSSQMGLVTAMTAAAGAIIIKDVIGYEPSPRTLTTPAKPYEYDASSTIKYLEENGYRGQKFMDDYDGFILGEEKKFPEIKTMAEFQKENYLMKKYDEAWMDKIKGQLSETQRTYLKMYSDSIRNPSIELGQKNIADALSILTKEKIYKHSSDPSKWLSLAEYLSKADEGLDVEYKVINKMMSEKYKGYVESSVEQPHLQVFKKSTGIMTSEIPIIAVTDNPAVGPGQISHPSGNRNLRVMLISLDSKARSLQQTAMTLVHETSHETTYAVESFEKLSLDKISSKLGTEGLASYDEYRFANEQKASGMSGFEIEIKAAKNFRLRAASFENRIYGDGPSIYEFIRDRYGQEFVDKIKKGEVLLEEKVDVKGMDSIFRTSFLPPLTDSINSATDHFLKIEDKLNEIKKTAEADMQKPDISKLNKYVSDLDGLHESISKDSLMQPKARNVLTAYVIKLKNNIQAYRDAPEELRVKTYTEGFMKVVNEFRVDLANSLAQESAELAKVSGGITKEKVPAAQFNAVEDAANKLLEKTRKIKQLDNVLTEKSLQSLNTAENSILKGKVPEELTKTAEVAKKSAGGQMAIGAGTAMVFALGPKFKEYGQENNNPYLVATGETIEYAGLGLFVASAGATVASWVGIALPSILTGLVLTTETFLSGTVIGLLAVAFIEMLWCAVNPFGPLCFGYIQPSLTLSKTKGFTGEKIQYSVSGFDIKNGIGNQEGKRYMLTYFGSHGLQLNWCTVSGDICKGDFYVPSTASDTVKIFAQDIDNTYRSTSVTFQKIRNQLVMGATIVTDKSYLCMYAKEWQGETDIEATCAKA